MQYHLLSDVTFSASPHRGNRHPCERDRELCDVRIPLDGGLDGAYVTTQQPLRLAEPINALARELRPRNMARSCGHDLVSTISEYLFVKDCLVMLLLKSQYDKERDFTRSCAVRNTALTDRVLRHHGIKTCVNLAEASSAVKLQPHGADG